MEIIWELPGKTAKRFRRQCAHLICRILGGDRTLIDQIEARYQNTPVEEKEVFLAHTDRPAPKRRRMTLAEYTPEELQEYNKREVELVQMRMDTTKMQMEMFEKLGGLDERDKIFFKDLMRVQSLSSSASSSSSSSTALLLSGTTRGAEISIPLVSQQIGVRVANGQAGRIGKNMVKRWRAKHGHGAHVQPPKRITYFKNKPYPENTYYMEDIDIMEAAIREVCNKPAPDNAVVAA